MTKRFVLDPHDDLFKKVHPVLLDIFCHGVLAAESKWLVSGALLSVIGSPLGWVVAVFKKAIDLAILAAVWWFLSDQIAQYPSLGYMFVVLAIVAIFYRDLHDELRDIFLYCLVIVSGGRFLRWMCAGYLTGGGFRQQFFKDSMETVTASMVPSVPNPYRDQYQELMDLYFGSNQRTNEEKLNRRLEEYSQLNQRHS